MASRAKGATALVLASVVAGMVGVSFAAVPLYRLFCQVTGFAGTTQTAVAAPAEALDRVITVRFNADIGKRLPWRFRPDQGAMELQVGEQGLAFFTAANTSDETVAGHAVFNVTPLKAGRYFTKIQCFCFDKQVLEPGESASMPVTFFVDPEIIEDPNLDDVSTITLSYTFFRTAGDTAPDSTEVSERTSSLQASGGDEQS
jgi:cytochrome c oxidase assembly protein subunit 11